jgi:DNA invertase Pin-like site-specific DNA recombinase
MMLQMMGVIAELERELIKERTQSGILASMRK